jgi:hypothetical protein
MCVASIAAAAVIFAAGGGDAHAWTNSYCGSLIYGYSWCSDNTNHSYDDNKAIYSGSGSVQVCERLRWADQPWEVKTPFCAINLVHRTYGYNTQYLYEADVQHKDPTNVRHTITGVAVA